ncbi:MAG: hypothetical protein IJK96_04005 [Bacteroidales bacterium]|nr:hypothetical protein [Bacteroidales bacterium]
MQHFSKVAIFIFILLFLLSGCSQKDKGYALPEFKKVEQASFEIIGEELLGVNASTNLLPYKSYLILVAYDASNKNCLHIFDKNGKPVISTVRIGRGPGEILFPGNPSFDRENGILTFFDLIGKKTLAIDINLLSESGQLIDSIIEEYRELSYPTLSRLTNKGRVDFNGVLPLGKDTGPRFVYVDYTTNDTLTFNDYPLKFGDDAWDKYYMYDTNTMMELSPKGDKMAICSQWCGILETFSIGSEFKLISTSYFAEPKYSGQKNGGGMIISDEAILVFNDIYTTDKELLCAYDGGQRGQSIPGNWYNKIAIFDWKGKPIKEIITDKRIEQLCMTQEGQIFALVNNALGECYLAKLP